MENNQMNLLGQRKKYRISSWVKFSLSVFAVIFLFQLVLPMEAFADIQSSVNHAGDSITKLVRNITAAIGTAIIAGGFLANMMPIMEVSQKLLYLDQHKQYSLDILLDQCYSLLAL
ncbi:hypothetical protein EAC61_RS12545 [Enterococcus hirae]